MGQEASSPSPPLSSASSSLPANHPPTAATTSESACPVDHKSRETWMKAAQQQKSAEDASTSRSPPRPRMTNSRLSTHREVSSIPRGWADSTSPSSAEPAVASARASTNNPSSHGTTYSAPPSQLSTTSTPNAQSLDPHTSADGTWIYPSEEMFFNAMRRKNYAPKQRDMSSIIPIHNAVNERTWGQILSWERAYNTACPLGPKLVRFQGDSTKLTPRARWYALLGYERPFDRHDWVVDRCGTRVEYVIDFYQGKGGGGLKGIGPSFYLDVRPKINSWEGVRMRMLRATGLEGKWG